MPKLLPPEVGARLACCATYVEVWGISPGATVDLRIDGTITSNLVAGTATTFVLGHPLQAGAEVDARQELAGSGTSGWGSKVSVEDVKLPPDPPHIEPEIPSCGRCVVASGAAPGSTVHLVQDGKVVAEGSINRHGWTCLALRKQPQKLLASTTTCGVKNQPPDRAIDAIERSKGLLPPAILEPVFGCQNRRHGGGSD